MKFLLEISFIHIKILFVLIDFVCAMNKHLINWMLNVQILWLCCWLHRFTEGSLRQILEHRDKLNKKIHFVTSADFHNPINYTKVSTISTLITSSLDISVHKAKKKHNEKQFPWQLSIRNKNICQDLHNALIKAQRICNGLSIKSCAKCTQKYTNSRQSIISIKKTLRVLKKGLKLVLGQHTIFWIYYWDCVCPCVSGPSAANLIKLPRRASDFWERFLRLQCKRRATAEIRSISAT